MQRVLHSIFTARILLNLREAATQDRIGTETSDISRDTERKRTDTALSSVIIGVDTWFRDTPSRTQRGENFELAVV